MDLYWQAILTGLSLGAVYALLAVGMTIIYNVNRVLNFAHGEFAMAGGMLLILLATDHGLPLPLAIVLTLLVGVLIGVVMERAVVRPVRMREYGVVILITLGAGYVIKGVGIPVWGKEPRGFQFFSGLPSLNVGGAVVRVEALLVVGMAVLVVALLWYFYMRTATGKAMRACAENPRAASLMGISHGRMMSMAFAMGAGLGALAGVMASPLMGLDFEAGGWFVMKAFVAAILGGIDNVLGAALGGLLLGTIEAVTALFIPSIFKESIAFLVIVLVLALRPQGMLGQKQLL